MWQCELSSHLGHPHATLEFLGTLLLIQLLANKRMQMHGIPSSLLWPDPVPTVTDTCRIRYQLEDSFSLSSFNLFPCLSSRLTQINKIIIFLKDGIFGGNWVNGPWDIFHGIFSSLYYLLELYVNLQPSQNRMFFNKTTDVKLLGLATFLQLSNATIG